MLLPQQKLRSTLRLGTRGFCTVYMQVSCTLLRLTRGHTYPTPSEVQGIGIVGISIRNIAKKYSREELTPGIKLKLILGNRARRAVKALGGGVRQIGFMAAAGLYALGNMVARLQDDHDAVQKIADGKKI